MPKIIAYNRDKALEYAGKWALGRNPAFYDFTGIGGDCTNFASQCLYAGTGIMNYTKTFGWYYISSRDRAPAWSGAVYLYQFLTANKTRAVFGEQTHVTDISAGDLIQLGDESSHFYHTLFVTHTGAVPDQSNILVSTHSFDAYMRPLSSYVYADIRFLHIIGSYQ